MFNGFSVKYFTLLILSAILPLSNAWADSAKPPAIVDGRLDLSHWSPQTTPVIELSGNWHFIANQLVSPAELIENAASIQSATVLQPVPASWNNRVGDARWPNSGHGTGTYWITITGGSRAAMSLLVHRACTNARVYVFSPSRPTVSPLLTLGTVGAFAEIASPYMGNGMAPLPATSGVQYLLIQVSNFDFFSGGLCGAPSIGNAELLQHHIDKQISNASMLTAMVAMAALYLIGLMTQPHNRNRRALWLTALCFSSFLFFLATSGLFEALIMSEQRWIYELRIKLAFIGTTWASTSLVFFYANYFPLYKYHRLLNTCLSISLGCTAFMMFSSAAWITAQCYYWLVYWGLLLALSASILIRANLHQLRYSLHMLIAVIPLMITVPYDAWHRVASNEMPVLSLYALVFFIFAHGILIGRRISEAVGLAEKLSLHLKDEVNIRTAELKDRNQKLRQTQRELEEANEALKKLSITDGLTGIYNRMHFDQEFRREWRRSARLRKPVSVLMIDVDHFKQLNDSAGHLAGDLALRSIASALHQHFKRAGDIVARYGGEEFVVMLPDTDQRTALAVAEGIRCNIEKLVFNYNDTRYLITISIGISTATPAINLSPDGLLASADAALYKAKNAGRNRVEAIPLLPAGPVERKQRNRS